MGNKNTISKSSGGSDDVIRAGLRKDNLNHEAEIEMLIAICEKHGIIVKREEKTCEISIEFSRDSPKSLFAQTTTPSPAPPPTAPSQSHINIDPRKFADFLGPIIKSQIEESIDEKEITATAYVDSSILVKNNKDVFDEVTKVWLDYAERHHSSAPAQPNGKSPVIAFGDDVCYNVEDNDTIFDVHGNHARTTEKGYRPSKIKIFFGHVWSDIVTSWWKCAAYIIAMTCLVAAIANWYKSYRLEQVVKEYCIIKPILREDHRYGPFIQALDSAIISSGVDEVCEKLYGRDSKIKN